MGFLVPTGAAGVKIKYGFTVSVSENRYKKYGAPAADFLFNTGSLQNVVTNTNPITFSRSSTATFVGSDSFIKNSPINQPRFDHNPVTGSNLGILMEEERTNSWTYSEYPNQWTKTNITVNENSIISPNGKLVGTLLNSSSSGDNYVYQTHVENIPTFTIYAKAGNTNNLWVRLQSNVSGRNVAYNFNLSDGTFSAATGNTGNLTGWTERKSITNAGNGWYRIEIGFTSSTVTVTTEYQISASTDGSASASGETVYIWGAQLEKDETFPTSYIPTPPVFVSRASNATFFDASGNVSIATTNVARNSTFGTSEDGIYTEVGLLLEDSATNTIVNSEYIETFTVNELTRRSNHDLAPDQSFTAGSIVETAVNDYHKVFLYTTPSTGNLTLSTFIKNKQGNRNALLKFNDGGNDLGFYFNPSSGSSVGILTGAGTTAPTEFGFEKLANDWYRIHVSGIATVSGGECSLLVIDNTTNSTHVGTGTEGFYVWGFQMEENDFPTSYIETPPTFFSRSQTNIDSASFYQSNGIIGYAATNVARNNAYLPDENGTFYSAGLLLENETINLMTYSEDFNSWSTKVNISVSTDTTETNAPDGTQTADKITNTANEAGSSNTISSITGTHTLSVYVKYSGTTNWFRMTSGIGNPQAWFDINNGTVGTQSNGAVGKIQPVGNGWYRCIMTANFSGATSLGTTPSSANGSTTEGSGNSLYVWGYQAEQNSYETSYVPTTASTATRGKDLFTTSTNSRSADASSVGISTRERDVAVIEGSEFTSFYNFTEGSIFVQGGPKQINPSNGQVLVDVSDGSASNRTRISNPSSLSSVKLRVDNANVSQSIITANSTITGDNNSKVAIRYGTNDFSINSEGESDTDTSGTPSSSLSKFHIGCSSNINTQLNGHIQRLSYWTIKLTDEQLGQISQ